MQPRLATSNKWTPFPEDFSAKILQVFSENFTAEAELGEFIVDGRIYSEEILLRIGYLEKGRLKQINFEASKEYSQKVSPKVSPEEPSEEPEQQPAKQDAFKSIYACIDALGSAMEQYFDAESDEEDLEFPRSWEPFEFDDGTVYLQYSTVNTRLEAEADRWLETGDNKALVYEEEATTDDALSRAIVDNELAQEAQKRIRKGEPLN